MTTKVNRTKLYNLVGDVYEHYEQDRNSSQRTHTDNGWRLRSKKYGNGSTFHKVPLSESLTAYEYKYGMMPYCNETFLSADGKLFQVWDI